MKNTRENSSYNVKKLTHIPGDEGQVWGVLSLPIQFEVIGLFWLLNPGGGREVFGMLGAAGPPFQLNLSWSMKRLFNDLEFPDLPDELSLQR